MISSGAAHEFVEIDPRSKAKCVCVIKFEAHGGVEQDWSEKWARSVLDGGNTGQTGPVVLL